MRNTRKKSKNETRFQLKIFLLVLNLIIKPRAPMNSTLSLRFFSSQNEPAEKKFYGFDLSDNDLISFGKCFA